MIFIETSIFTKHLPQYMKDEEYRLFQLYLMNNSDKGDIIKGSGGVRKIRWAINNKGKSGGIRIIYYCKKSASETWLLTLYAKSEKESIPAHILKQIAQEIQND